MRPLRTAFFTCLLALSAWQAQAGPREIAAAVVGIKAEIPPEARTADSLGRQRSGSGVVIDSAGLVLTAGYLILEASAVDLYDAEGKRIPADIVAYDQETGFGLLRATAPLAAKPLRLAQSDRPAIGDPLLVVSRDGELGARQASLASRREFAASWEYLLPDALFTTPPHVAFAGAALVDREEHLVGVGSLFVGDATAEGVESPGNMFIPVAALEPILGDLLALGHRDGPGRPWVGLAAMEHGGRLIVRSVSDGGPAAAAGVQPGDIVIGVGNDDVGTLAELYRGMWQLGQPGVAVPLRLLRGSHPVEVTVPSIDRRRWLRLDQTY